MSLKKWVVGKVNGNGSASARRVAPSLGEQPRAEEPSLVRSDRRGTQWQAAHLGPYAPLIGAIREALEHFAASQVRLHLAIAEHDRYVLTSIEVESDGSEEERSLLRRFVAEFRPEQIKQYLAREVIAALRNASAIDLSQFAGLNALAEGRIERDDQDDDPYADLLADLRGTGAGAQPPAYEVTLLGRWAPADARAQPRAGGRGASGARETTHTPMAARTVTFAVEDAGGARTVVIEEAMPGRRYVVGKDERCDVVVDGTYASRRHCELWLEGGTWWVADAGSTNGIRVESSGSVLRAEGDGASVIPLRPGDVLVLSASARGATQAYPRVVLQAERVDVHQVADAHQAASPQTPIAPPIARRAGLTIAARMRSGVCEAEIAERALPFFVGRSRNQALVIDGAHDEVSGRHLEIVAIDDTGASVVVHGDNGVSVDGTAHGCGARFHWKAGQAMVLGRHEDAAACTLLLSRAG
jgi:pSer/pThr/pTyr-binding forkhead associated (FHA) protein